jgi:hypothetical protein
VSGLGEGEHKLPLGQRRLLGDETKLFVDFNPLLDRIVQRLVNTSPDIVDDACKLRVAEVHPLAAES